MLTGDVIIGILKGLAEGSKVLASIPGKDFKESSNAITAKPSNRLTDSELAAQRRLYNDRPKN